MKASSARAKGKALEDYVADQIIEKGIDPKARRDGGSGAGNREKADIITTMQILGQNAGIECKNHRNIAIKDWWKQAQKLEKLGREPVLVYKLPQDSYENTLCTIYLDTLLELVKGNKGSVEVKEVEDPQLRWKIDKAVYALKELLKEL